MITTDDINLFFPTLLEVVLFGFVVARIITFLPVLVRSILRKIKNSSVIYSDNHLHKGSIDQDNLNPSLDKADFGKNFKDALERWFHL